MKHMVGCWFMVMVALSWTVRAEEATEAVVAADVVASEAPAASEQPAGDAVAAWLPPAVVAFGDVDQHLVDRASAWAAQNLAIAVPVLPAQPSMQLGTLDEVAAAAAALLETNRVGLVVLWRPNSDVANHGAFYPDLRVSVANLNPMFTPDTEAETIERRIERQVIRGICMVFGLEPSPNPFSAMFAYGNLAELDAIGRNLDPPWLKKLQERARERGITVDPDSTYNMIQ